jgi:membrane protease YdiL (CAAX protease family)
MSTNDTSLSSVVSGWREPIQTHQIASFIVVTLGISWGWWSFAPMLVGGGELTRGLVIPGAFGPPIAAGVVTWASGGSVRAWVRQGLNWRVRPQRYLLALLLPIAAVLVGVGGALAVAGGPVDLSVLPQRLPLFVLSFVIAALIGGGQEEFGWRGFVLPRLQERYSALTASLLIGVLWAVWHFPLFLQGAPRNQTGSFLLYTILVIGLSILLTWQYNATGGSILLAMLLHGGFNASGNVVPAPISAIADWSLTMDIGMIVGVWTAALTVLILTNATTLSRRELPDLSSSRRESRASGRA